jgi:hypothetical protein
MEIRNNSFADHEALVIGIGTNNPGVLTTTTTGVLIIEDNATCHFDRLYMGADGGVGSLTIKDNATVVFGGQILQVSSWVGRNRIHAGGTTCVGGEATVNIEGGSVAFRPPMGNTTHGTFYLGWTGARGPLDPNLLLDVPPSIGVINMSGGVFTIEAGGTVASSWQVLALGASENNSRKMNPTGILNVTGGEFRTIGYTGQDPNDPNVTVRAPVHVILASSPESTGQVYVSRDATFSVDGDFLMKPGDKTGASAKLTVEIGRPTSALLQIADSAKLADTLRVECVGGYRPREGDLFTIVATGAGVTGGFDVITTNLTLGNAGFDGAVDANAYNVTFTGLTAGDANGDQSIDGGDLALMGGNWLRSGVTWTGADFNGDGEVDGGDLALMGGNWMWLLSPAPSQGVPEPATLALLALGGLALLRRKSA